MLKVEMLTEKCEEEYRGFLLEDPGNLIYATTEFRDFLADAVGGKPHYLIALRRGKIVGVLPYFESARSGHGIVINSLPWYGSHGGCTLEDKGDNEARKVLLEEYKTIITKSGVLSSTVILTPVENEALGQYLSILETPYVDRRMGQRSELPREDADLENRLMMSFRQKTRNLVRKSLRQGFGLDPCEEDRAWEFLHDTHKENMAAMGGRAKPAEHFAALRRHIPNHQRKLLLATLGDLPVAALLLLYFNKTIEYVTPVVKVEYRSQQPLSFLIWHGMLDGIKKGYRWWNWGGTWISQDSLYHFKAGWGAMDLPYAYCIKASQEAVERLQADFEGVMSSFPYYYIFPFHLI